MTVNVRLTNRPERRRTQARSVARAVARGGGISASCLPAVGGGTCLVSVVRRTVI